MDKTKTNNPSKWITEIQIPVHPKGIAKLSNTTPEISQDSIVDDPKTEKEISSELK